MRIVIYTNYYFGVDRRHAKTPASFNACAEAKGRYVGPNYIVVAKKDGTRSWVGYR